MARLRTIITALMAATAAIVLGIVAFAAPPLQTVTLLDKNGFERPIPALKVDVPQGWTVTGGIEWKQSTCTATANQSEWQASDPNSPKQFVFFPQETWSWSSLMDQMPQYAGQGSGGCPVARIFDAQTYMQQVIQARRPGVRILGMRPRPDAIQSLQQQYAGIGRQYGFEVGFEAVEALIAYQMNGVEMRESLMTIVQFTKTAMPDLNGGMSGYHLTGQSLGVLGLKAPDGQLDFALMEQVRRSLTLEPAYKQRMARYHANLSRQRAAANRSSGKSAQAKLNQTYSEIGDIIHNGYQDRTAIQDRMQSQTTDMILEQQAYIGTGGDTVYLPNSYDRAFEMNNGEYVVTDDQFFEPWRDTGMDGTELTPQEY